MASIKVAVRVRPFNKREDNLRSTSIIEMQGQKTIITNTRLPSGGGDTLGRERVKQFAYDHSYWSVEEKDAHFVSQEQVYEDLGQDVVYSAYQGYNACIFAYGQTGSGKTYTMMGTPENLGLIPRICENLFNDMKEADTSYRTEVSYLEIYNERARDLLRDKKQTQLSLKVREHPKDGPYVQDLSKHLVVDYNDIQELVTRGNANRTTAATNMNDASSRSHAIFTIVFTQAKFEDGIPSEIHSKINLVDLAGSERADTSGATGERLKEGGSINKSLVTLGNVISTLADLSDKLHYSPRKSVFIPYRDSGLTWLLKDSLGGNAKTIMIATISPADCNYAETLSTLRYASRAKKIVNKPTVNEDPNVKLIRELREENARLRGLLGQQKDPGQLEVIPSMRDFAQTKERLCRNEERMRKLTEKWTDKWQETANVLEEHKMLGLRREGTGVVLDSDLPYLLAIDDNILSTGMRLYHLKEGETRMGRELSLRKQDIALSGPNIEEEHCVFNHRNGEVTLSPLEGARCSVNNLRIHAPTKLTQGSIIRLGRHHVFRFNHPGEAAKLREELKENVMEGRWHTWPQKHKNGSKPLVKVWRDFQWTWSTTSLSQSALGSDLEVDLQSSISAITDSEREQLEGKRRELAQLEEAHCLAEAQRLSQLVEHEAQRDELRQKEQEVKRLSLEALSMKTKAEQAHKEIKNLSVTIEQKVNSVLKDNEQFAADQERHRQEREELERERVRAQQQLERDKARAKQERQRMRQKRELQKVKAEVENDRVELERSHLEEERRLLQEDAEKQREILERQEKHTNKMREVEKVIYRQDMAQVRNMVETQVWDMCQLVGIDRLDLESQPASKTLGEADDEDELDLEQFKIKVNAAMGPVVPLQYLERADNEGDSNKEDEAASAESHAGPRLSELDSTLTRLADQVTDIHLKVCEALQRKYSSVLSSDDHTTGLGQEVIKEFASIKPLFEQLEKLAEAHATKKALEVKLRDYDRLLTIVDKLIQIHEMLQTTDTKIRNGKFLAAIESVDAVNNLLRSLEVEEDLERNVQKVLQTEICVLREKLLFQIGETWNKMLKWTLPPESRRQARKPHSVTLEVTDLESDKEVLTSAIQAMHSVNMLDSRIKVFCDRLMMYFVEGVVTDRNTLLQVIDELDKYTLCVVLNAGGPQKRLMVPPAEAFQKLEQVFIFLQKPLAHIVVKESCEGASSLESRQPVTLVERLGQAMNKRLFECIYNECLSHAVPTAGGAGQWDKYNDMVRMTERFQDTLIRLGFLAPDSTTLMDYLNNVNSLFANIKSQEILKKAHQFMTQELMGSIRISSDHPLGQLKGEEEARRDAFVRECREKAGTSNYKLPVCQVSLPVRSLLCLAYDTLKEGTAASNEGALNLCHSVQSMFELYCDVVPSYHREKLRNLHLMAALHHNNCMFVAHHLITVEKMFQRKLDEASLAPGRAANLADVIPRVRRIGNDDFTEHMNAKKEQLCDHLCEAQGFSCVADDAGASATRAVQQMLRHLKHISAIWRDVLPINVYCRAIGSLLQSAITEIIASIVTIEEFSAEDCDYLQCVLTEIIDFGPEYFTLDDLKQSPQVVLHESVPSWFKLKELAHVLNSGLQEVSDRWADGKGPLAMHFTGEEIKKLVVAMFENTSKRDAILAQLSRRPSVHLS